MRSTTSRISLGSLPLRSRPLRDAELNSVFGGCSGDGGACDWSCDCCQGFGCNLSSKTCVALQNDGF
jgi:hypothetical protein